MNKYLIKVSQLVSDQAKKDIVGTGTIAALGGLGTLAAHKMLPSNAGAWKVMGVGTGIGLAADYAGLKLSHAYNKHVDGQVKHASTKNTTGDYVETAADMAGTAAGGYLGYKHGLAGAPVDVSGYNHTSYDVKSGKTTITHHDHLMPSKGYLKHVGLRTAAGAVVGGLAAGGLVAKIRKGLSKKEDKE